MNEYLFKHYLPPSHFGKVESILQSRPQLIGRIVPVDETYDLSPVDSLSCAVGALIIDFAREFWAVDEPIYLCLVENDVQNALATRLDDGAYVVVVFMGLVARLCFYADLLSRTKPIMEVLDLKTSGETLGLENLSEVVFEDRLPVLGPMPQENLEIMSALTFWMVGAIVFHELGHILDGHIAFLDAANSSKLGDGQVWEGVEQKALTSETLEFDADAFASVGWMAIRHERPTLPVVFSTFLRDLRSYSRFVLVCLGGLYLYEDIFSVQDLSWADTAASHSPSKIRLLNAFFTLREVLGSRHKLKPDEVDEYLNPVFSAVLLSGVLYHQIRIEDREQYLQSLQDEEEAFERYKKRILGRWARIRPILTPLQVSKNGNLAAAQADPI